MNKIAAVVILYYPEKETIEHILSYCSLVDVVYAIDNSEHPDEEFRREINKIPNCLYYPERENHGISKRLNQACERALEKEYEWLLTMDQDSFFDKNGLAKYLDCVRTYATKNEVAMFGVEYVERSKTSACDFEEVVKIITSGSLVNLSLFSLIGGFDEALFIDEVDLEYCYKSISKGYKIVKVNNVFLNHSLGKVGMHRSLKTFKPTPRILHSPLRVYYMVRNSLYVNRKYENQFEVDKGLRKSGILNRIKNNLLYGKDKMQLIKYIIKAYLDYKKQRMGKL